MRFLHDPMRPRLIFSILLSLAVSGCDSCHASKPYTPYTLSDNPSAAPSAAPSTAASAPAQAMADAGAPADAGPGFSAVVGAPPPGDGKAWPLEGGAAVTAPVGRTFGAGLLLDTDGDGKRDLLAWA